MKKVLKSICVLTGICMLAPIALSGCSTQQQNAPASETSYTAKNDYYEYINDSLLASKEIPEDRGRWSYFDELENQVYDQLCDITQTCVSGKDQFQPGSTEQKIADLYLSAMDTDTKNQAAFGDLKQYIDDVMSADSIEEYISAVGAYWNATGMQSIFSFKTTVQDPKDSSKYLCNLDSINLVLKQQIYESSNQQALLDEYKQYIEKIMTLLGNDSSSAKEYANQIFDFQKQIASYSLSESESYDPSKTYHLYDQNQLADLFPNIDTQQMLKAFGLDSVSSFNIVAPEAEQQLNSYLTPDHLPMLKQYSAFCMVNDFAKYMGDEFSAPYYEFRQKVNGATGTKSNETRANELTQTLLEWDFGRLYAEKYFSEQAKQNVEAMVNEILNAYQNQIDALDWMSAPTKEKAKKKLSSMIVKIGYPETWPSYTQKVDIPSENGVFVNNALNITKAKQAANLNAMSQPVDRTKWQTTPQTINAYYEPANNEIVFPAGILQAPFYDINHSFEENLGGIGSVIGHEITHAFDNSGAQYDENGNYTNWWTDEDYAKFNELVENVITYYNGYQMADGLYVNGEQTAGENIADLGSLSCISKIVGNDPEKLQSVYRNYATIWACKYTDNALKTIMNIDPHAPGKIRVNAVLSSTDEFYQAYPEIQPGDEMYVSPENRVKIW